MPGFECTPHGRLRHRDGVADSRPGWDLRCLKVCFSDLLQSLVGGAMPSILWQNQLPERQRLWSGFTVCWPPESRCCRKRGPRISPSATFRGGALKPVTCHRCGHITLSRQMRRAKTESSPTAAGVTHLNFSSRPVQIPSSQNSESAVFPESAVAIPHAVDHLSDDAPRTLTKQQHSQRNHAGRRATPKLSVAKLSGPRRIKMSSSPRGSVPGGDAPVFLGAAPRDRAPRDRAQWVRSWARPQQRGISSATSTELSGTSLGHHADPNPDVRAAHDRHLAFHPAFRTPYRRCAAKPSIPKASCAEMNQLG
jgi:hypothetical protein